MNKIEYAISGVIVLLAIIGGFTLGKMGLTWYAAKISTPIVAHIPSSGANIPGVIQHRDAEGNKTGFDATRYPDATFMPWATTQPAPDVTDERTVTIQEHGTATTWHFPRTSSKTTAATDGGLMFGDTGMPGFTVMDLGPKDAPPKLVFDSNVETPPQGMSASPLQLGETWNVTGSVLDMKTFPNGVRLMLVLQKNGEVDVLASKGDWQKVLVTLLPTFEVKEKKTW